MTLDWGLQGSTLLRPRIMALDTVVKQHKVDALLDVGECVHDLKENCLSVAGRERLWKK